MTPANVRRLNRWRARMAARRLPYDVGAHVVQQTLGVAWHRRREDGLLAVDEDGYLPLNTVGEARRRGKQ
jgi:hypothetical protein